MASPFPGGFIFCGGRWPGAYGFCGAGRLPSFGAGGVSAGKRQKGWFYDRAAEGRDWFAAVPGAEGFRRSAAARRLCPGRLPRRPAVRAESGRSAAPRFLRQNSMAAPVSPTVTVTSRPM